MVLVDFTRNLLELRDNSDYVEFTVFFIHILLLIHSFYLIAKINLSKEQKIIILEENIFLGVHLILIWKESSLSILNPPDQ